MTRASNILCLSLCSQLLLSAGADSAEHRLAYAGMNAGYWQLYTDEFQGGSRVPITDTPFDKRCLRAVPGGDQLLFRDNEGRLFQIDARKGAMPRPVLPQVDVVKDFDLHPGRGFLISTYAPNATDSLRIWWHSQEGSERRLVVAESKLNEMPRWHRERSFYFVRAKGGHTQVFQGSLDSQKTGPLFPNDDAPTTDPAPSPDGNRIAYCRESDHGMDLWVASWDGSNPQRLYTGPGLEAEPCWRPDGRELFFTSWDGKNFRIARVADDGTGFSWVTAAAQDCRYPAVTTTRTP